MIKKIGVTDDPKEIILFWCRVRLHDELDFFPVKNIMVEQGVIFVAC